MSWDAWVAPLIPTFKAAAIFGLNGAPWANRGVNASPAEVKTALSLFVDGASPAFANGITIAGVKYLCVKADSSSVYGKKGAEGCVLIKTKQAMVVGVYGENTSAGNAANAAEKLADSLRGSGY